MLGTMLEIKLVALANATKQLVAVLNKEKGYRKTEDIKEP